jgi:hypothetical protein
LLPSDHQYQVIGGTLYDALRNGLVHGYDTKRIRWNSSSIGLLVSWEKESHLKVITWEGKPCLVLNVQSLADRLSAEIDSFRDELRTQPRARDRFVGQLNQDKEKYVVRPEEIEAWNRLLEPGG